MFRLRRTADEFFAAQPTEEFDYPALHRLERRGWIRADWGTSDRNRRAKFYELTRAGRMKETRNGGRQTGRLTTAARRLDELGRGMGGGEQGMMGGGQGQMEHGAMGGMAMGCMMMGGGMDEGAQGGHNH